MLELTLSLDKKTHTLDQEIPGIVSLRNSGQEPLLVNARLAVNKDFAPQPFREVHLMLTDPEGEPVDFMAKINVGRPQGKDYRDLQPGERVERPIDLSMYYMFERAGEYAVRAVYENQVDPENGREAWKGQLESNTVTFVVE